MRINFSYFFGENTFFRIESAGQYTLAASLDQRIDVLVELKCKGLLFFKIVKLIVTCYKF